jgi:hypothetical protein
VPTPVPTAPTRAPTLGPTPVPTFAAPTPFPTIDEYANTKWKEWDFDGDFPNKDDCEFVGGTWTPGTWTFKSDGDDNKICAAPALVYGEKSTWPERGEDGCPKDGCLSYAALSFEAYDPPCEEGSGEEGGGMMTTIIIILVLICCAGGGYFFYQKKKKSKSTEVVAVQDNYVADTKDGDKATGEDKPEDQDKAKDEGTAGDNAKVQPVDP